MFFAPSLNPSWPGLTRPSITRTSVRVGELVIDYLDEDSFCRADARQLDGRLKRAAMTVGGVHL